MNEHDLLSRTCETVAGYLALGNERFEAHGATFVRNRATPGRYDANHVGLIRSSDAAAIEALLTRAEAEFEGLGHRRFDIDPLTPPAVEARLALASGFTTSAGLHLLLEGELKAAPKPFDIREIADAGWLGRSRAAAAFEPDRGCGEARARR